MSLKLVKQNTDAFDAESLFLAYYERVFDWALHLTGHNQTQAEDLVHDVFIQLSLNPPKIEQIENWENYLFIVLRNFHRYRLRRELRKSPQNHISITDFDSLEAGLQSFDGFENRLRVWEDLQIACEYACRRKETSRAGSVFLLRFFHGYYPTEIARIFCAKRSAVAELLRISRAEVRTVLENPNQLALFKAENFPKDFPEIRLSEYSTEAVIKNLRERVFAAKTGKCLDAETLKEIYQNDFAELLDRPRLAHIVSCAECLNRINKILGLSDLSDRFPPDMLGPDGVHKVLPFPPKAKDRNQQKYAALDKFRHRLRALREHEPREIWVMANEMILGTQPVSQAVNEQTLGLEKVEEVHFVSVFSEQNVLLFAETVAAPPIGDFEQKSRIVLNENRSLTVNLSFCGNWQNVQVIFEDSTLEKAFEVEKIEEKEVSSENETPPITTFLPEGWTANFSRFFSKEFWLRPTTITILIAVPLIALLIFWRLNLPETNAPNVVRTVLEKAIKAEKMSAPTAENAVRQTIEITEIRHVAGETISRRNIEIWKQNELSETAKFTTAKQIFDQNGKAVAGEWQNADGIKVRKSNVKTAKNEISELVWLAPSMSNLTNLTNNDVSKINLTESENSFVLEAENPQTGATIKKISLTINKADYRPTGQKILAETNGELREFRFVETKFETRPTNEIPPDIFNPDALFPDAPKTIIKPEEQAITPTAETPTETAKPLENSNLNTETTKPANNVATAETEIEALNLLNSVKADLNEQIAVVRVPNSKLKISGIVETDRRKAEILRTLAPLSNNPAVEIKIRTVTEAVQERNQQKRKNSGENAEIIVEQKDSDGVKISAEDDLRSFFKSRGVSDERIEAEIRNFAQNAFSRSRRVAQNAGALRQISTRFSPAEIENLTPQAKQSWLALMRKQARNLQAETAELRQMLAPVFSAGGGSAIENFNRNDFAQMQKAAASLATLANETDRQIRAAFSVSASNSAAQTLKTHNFWSNFRRIEQTAAALAQD